jgi:hypothetical protein
LDSLGDVSARPKIDVNGQPVLCTVVEAKGAKPGAAGASRGIDTTYRFWIDKATKVIWKETERTSGPIFPDLPYVEYMLDRTTLFKFSEPDAQTASAELFVFSPNGHAELVQEFHSPREKMVQAFPGQRVPAITLGMKDGKTV